MSHQTDSTQATDWLPIGALADIPTRGARVVKTTAGCVAVFRTADDRVFALDDRCPHEGGPLSQGIVHGHQVTCPLHNLVVDLSTGGSKEGTVRQLDCRVVDGQIFLKLQSLSAPAAQATAFQAA